MTQVTVAEASLNLASLLALVRGGENVLIADGTLPPVRLVLPVETARPHTLTKEESIWQTYRISPEEFYQRYPEYAPPANPDGERVFGSLEGQIWMSDDFDAPLDECKELANAT